MGYDREILELKQEAIEFSFPVSINKWIVVNLPGQLTEAEWNNMFKIMEVFKCGVVENYTIGVDLAEEGTKDISVVNVVDMAKWETLSPHEDGDIIKGVDGELLVVKGKSNKKSKLVFTQECKDFVLRKLKEGIRIKEVAALAKEKFKTDVKEVNIKDWIRYWRIRGQIEKLSTYRNVIKKEIKPLVSIKTSGYSQQIKNFVKDRLKSGISIPIIQTEVRDVYKEDVKEWEIREWIMELRGNGEFSN